MTDNDVTNVAAVVPPSEFPRFAADLLYYTSAQLQNFRQPGENEAAFIRAVLTDWRNKNEVELDARKVLFRRRVKMWTAVFLGRAPLWVESA